MMLTTVEVDDLTGAALDWAVAKAEGRTVRRDPLGLKDGSYWIWEDTPSGLGGILIGKSVYMSIGGKYSPSTNWAQAGPLLERERIATFPAGDGWSASYQITSNTLMRANGPTPLVAGLRCYVAGHHGQTVDVPAELLET